MHSKSQKYIRNPKHINFIQSYSAEGEKKIPKAACTFTRHVKPRNCQNGAGWNLATSPHFSFVPDFRSQVVAATVRWLQFFLSILWMKCIFYLLFGNFWCIMNAHTSRQEFFLLPRKEFSIFVGMWTLHSLVDYYYCYKQGARVARLATSTTTIRQFSCVLYQLF